MALFCTPCLQSRFQVYIPTVWYNLHSVFRSLTIILTYKDCPSDKRGLRRTQIRHLARWVRTLETVEWWKCDGTGYPALFASSKHVFCFALWQGSGSASSQRYLRWTPTLNRPWGTCGHWSGQMERRNTHSSSRTPACESCFCLIYRCTLKKLHIYINMSKNS